MSLLDKAALLSQITEEDRGHFAVIESHREAVMAQGGVVHFRDFGAGSPEAALSQEAMHEGVEVEKPIQDLCRTGLKEEWAHYLYALVKMLRPQTVLELGTCCGFSSSYMAKACRECAIHTIEGAAPVADIARSNHAALQCDHITVHVGRFTDVLPDLLPKIAPINMVFIDGHHDERATLEYDAMIRPHMNPNGILLYDDIGWSEGMHLAWEQIKRLPHTEMMEDGKLGVVRL